MRDLLADLKAFEGRELGTPIPAPDEVNQAMIRHWCEAVDDRLPIYDGPDAVAPPTMLQAWTMRGFRPKPAPPSPADELYALLDEHGFTSVVATNCEQDYPRYLRLGDRLSVTSVIESVSEEKQTALGRGHFCTSRLTYRDQHDEVVGEMLFRILKFMPGTGSPPAAARSGEGQSTRESAQRVVELPTLAIPLTRSLIVATAIASRDYQDVHHDHELAQQRGSKDIFMNILSTNGFVGRYVTDWAGPDARITSVAIRLGAPNYPGDTMTLTGRYDEGVVSVVGRNSLGAHVTGTVSLSGVGGAS
jgi:hypothetical protein